MTTTLDQLPPGTYVLDPDRSMIGFEAKLLLGLKAKGRFERFEACVEVGTSLATSSMTATVWTESLRTGIGKRDEHLRADNVLASGTYPTFEFRSTAITQAPDGYDVEGVLRVRDVSRPVAFRAIAARDAAGRRRFTAELTVTPGDFGVTRRGTTKPVTALLDVALVPQPQATKDRPQDRRNGSRTSG